MGANEVLGVFTTQIPLSLLQEAIKLCDNTQPSEPKEVLIPRLQSLETTTTWWKRKKNIREIEILVNKNFTFDVYDLRMYGEEVMIVICNLTPEEAKKITKILKIDPF